MKKRGQVTIFIILGIIIVAVIGLFLFAKDAKIIPPILSGNVDQELQEISEHLASCVLEEAPDCIEKISLQGGFFETPEGTFRLWNDTSVSYLCYNKQGDERCINRALTLATVENEVKKCVDQQLGPLGSCININQFDRQIGLEVTLKKNYQQTRFWKNQIEYPCLLRHISRK